MVLVSRLGLSLKMTSSTLLLVSDSHNFLLILLKYFCLAVRIFKSKNIAERR